MTDLALDSLGTRAARCMLNEAHDLATRDSESATQVHRLTSDAVALTLRCRFEPSDDPIILPKWHALSQHLLVMGEWLAKKDRQRWLRPTDRAARGRTAEILIHVSNAAVFDLMSDNPTPDAVTHFYNVICLIGKFTERLVRSHQVASGQKRFLRWPDTLVMQALEGVCRAMEAFVEKETVLSLGMASKRGAAAYLEELAGILQRQILSSLMATTGYPGDAFAVMGSANQRWHHPARPTGAGATTRTCPDAE